VFDKLLMFNMWLGVWEPLWLFSVLVTEMLLGFGTLLYVVKEYYYDAAKDAKPRKTKRKGSVKVVVDSEGQAVITNQPKGIDVEITQKGEE
jgi:hypothetical protein